MSRNPTPSFWQLGALYLACYVVWVALAGLGLWLCLNMLTSLVDITTFFSLNPWVIDLFYKVGAIVLILVWLVGVIVLEVYLRKGVPKRRLWPRAAYVLLVEVVLLVLAYGVHFVLG